MKRHDSIRLIRYLAAAVVVCALVPRRDAVAQEARAGAPSVAWTTATSFLGITNFRCDCTFTNDGESRRVKFRSEPMVLGVIARGPAYGLLRRGDYITHIDGHSLLSDEGARRFARIGPDDDVNLTIRRDGGSMKVSIHTSAPRSTTYIEAPEAAGGYVIDWDAPPTPAVAPTLPAPPAGVVTPTPRVPRAPRAAVAPGVWVGTPPVPPSVATPKGWFGFSIRCSDCGWYTTSANETPIWESEEPPEVSMVSPGSPAARAGIREGDRITHIDGLSILSKEGARRFGAVGPGQRVRLTLRRGNSTVTSNVTLATRPEVRAARAAVAATAPRTPRAPSLRRELRYSGTLDNVQVEVWSAGGPTIDKTGDTMVITVGGSVIRLKVDPKKSP